MSASPPKNGLAIKRGNARTTLSINAVKVLKNSKDLAKTTKASLERAAKAPPEAAMQIEIFRDAKVIASSPAFRPAAKNKNAFETMFTACRDVDTADAAKQMRALAKENPTSSFYKKIAMARNGAKYTMTISFRGSGRSKRTYNSTIVINIRGGMHFIDCATVSTVNDAVKNLRYTLKQLAKASGCNSLS
jgi:hypothetical protein